MARELLVFRRHGQTHALPAELVGEVGFDRVPEPVPLAPAGVAGLVLDHGRLLTVLDLDRLLPAAPQPDAPAARSYLVRLRPPFAHLALRLRADARLEREAEGATAGVEPLDVASLVRELEGRVDAADRERRR